MAEHSSHSLVLPWNEYCDLLGGATWTEACEGWAFREVSPDRKRILPRLAARFTEPRQFFFSENHHPPLPLEVFWIKWRLFAALCDRIFVVHRDLQRPHLGLNPNNMRVVLPDFADSVMPVRWTFSIELEHPEGALPFTHDQMPPALSDRLFVPPHALESLYQAPEQRDWPLGKEDTVTVLVRSLERIRASNGDAEIRASAQVHVLSDAIQASWFSPKDVFLVLLTIPETGESPVRLWGSKVESPERGLVVNGVTEPLSARMWDHLQQAQRSTLSQSRLVSYRAFHVPCDLYSLGIMLLHMLVGHDDRTKARLEQALGGLIRDVQGIVRSLGTEEPTFLNQRIYQRLRQEGMLFSKQGVVAKSVSGSGVQGHIQDSSADSIPDVLWTDGLGLALKLITRIPGFSYCANSGDFDSVSPHTSMERVCTDVSRIGKWLNLELFGSRERNREILEACALVRQERNI